jgi:hypothetical protein
MDMGKCGACLRTFRGIAQLGAEVAVVHEARANIEIIEQLAGALLQEATAASAANSFTDAVPRLVLLRRHFQGTKAAESAAAQLAKLKANPEARDALAAVDPRAPQSQPKTPAKKRSTSDPEAAAKRLLSLARNYLANQRADKARELLERIIDKHPTSACADQAKALLEEIR